MVRGALVITQNGAYNPTLINGSNVAQFVPVNSIDKKTKNISINKIDFYKLVESGVVDVDLSIINDAIGDNSKSLQDDNLLSNLNYKNSDKNFSDSSNDLISNLNEKPSDANLIFAGKFKVNLDPSSISPVIEARSQFIDPEKYFGSSYYFSKFGLDKKKIVADIERALNQGNLRMLGDSFSENRLIKDQLQNLRVYILDNTK